MSHFNNVKVLLDNAEAYDNDAVRELIETEESEVLADDIVYVVTSILALLSGPERKRVKELLLRDITSHDFRTLTDEIGDDQSG